MARDYAGIGGHLGLLRVTFRPCRLNKLSPGAPFPIHSARKRICHIASVESHALEKMKCPSKKHGMIRGK